MAKNNENLQIVSELAEEIKNETQNIDTKQVSVEETQLKENSVHTTKSSNIKNKPKPLSAKDLEAKRQIQNLAERKILLRILAILLGLQLFFMNAVVLVIILWSAFDFDCFRELDAEILKCILDFTKYYVTAVLVELLGGIIYIVHRVFTENNN